MRAVVSLALSASLVVAVPFPAFAAASLGTVAGQVKVDGRALLGVDLSVVDVASGAIHRVRTNDDGTFRLNVGPGQYVLASDAGSGLAVAKAPSMLVVQSGQIVTAQLELTAVAGAAVQDAPAVAPTAAGNVGHETVDCVLAGQHPMLDATFDPAGSVQRARLYFKSPSSEFFYSEMQPTGTGSFRGFMPRPTMEANPITYYIAATTTDFAEIRTPDITVQVVEKEEDCKDRKLAPVGTPPPGTQFFTAAGAAGTPSGFAAGVAGAVGGGAGISTTALLLGTGLVGITIAAVILSDDNPSPSPSPIPPPPSPSPLPSPSPSPSPTPTPPTSPFR